MPPPTKELLQRLEKEDGGYDRDDCLKALLETKGDEAEVRTAAVGFSSVVGPTFI